MTRFNIFPVGSDKAPLIRGLQTKATSDPATIDHWQAQGVRAWGIPCGKANDLFVIDLDVDKASGERTGAESLLGMTRYAWLYDHAFVATPSGGRHIYCRHFDGARNSTSKIAPKIDTRGEGGYVVAPGSEIAGGLYVGSIGEELPVVPIGLRALLLHTPNVSQKQDRGETPRSEVEDLLSHIPADLSYGEWLSGLMGLHDKYGGSDEGLAIADSWSARGSKYRPGEVRSKWRGFQREGVTWSTIPAIARQHGADLSSISRRHRQ